MFNDEINEVYKKLDELFKLKAKRIVKGSGLKFDRLLSAVDLVKGYEFNILIINGNTINFKDQKSLCIQLIHHCRETQKEKQNYLTQLEHHKQHDLHFDDVTYDPMMEQLYYEIEKIGKFVGHLKDLTEKFPTQD